jgi:hypothetical protein
MVVMVVPAAVQVAVAVAHLAEVAGQLTKGLSAAGIMVHQHIQVQAVAVQAALAVGQAAVV